MKKIYTIGLIFLFILGGMQTVAVTQNPTKQITIQFIDEFSQPSMSINYNNDIEFDSLNKNTYLMNPGKPLLPMNIKTIELPFGVDNIHVQLNPTVTSTSTITNDVTPAPYPQSYNIHATQKAIQPKKDTLTYQSDETYPSEWFTFDTSCGRNTENNLVTFVNIFTYPIRYKPESGTLLYMEQAEFTVDYSPPSQPISFSESTYDLVIIAPSVFSNELQQLVDHKNSFDMRTFLKTTEEIYNDYPGRDKPEQIKYFIKDTFETTGINYVLLVGGLNSLFMGSSRDDKNQGSKDWHVPVRYSNLNLAMYGDDPGFITDLYYSDIYKTGGVFDDWDSNENDIFGEWDESSKDNLDLTPDLSIGRLACRNLDEVSIMINKIISYEQTPADSSWFQKMLVISGDAFQDQQDLDIQWDISNTDLFPNGIYTIHAKSNNDEGIFGPVDQVDVTIDRSASSRISFSENDHLITDSYPFDPIALITSPSNNNILGNTEVDFVPPQAYDGYSWAQVQFIDNIMHIRGKSYDPKPYGNITDIHIWITNNDGETVFSAYKNNTETYYEDEWATGEKIVDGRGGSLYYMPETFDKIKLFTSNGQWTGQNDVIDAFSKGAGFVHFSGHASPQAWGDQYPGIPGGRFHASINGLLTFNPFGLPMFPMSKLENNEKLPIVVACGCHNGQFNVTLLSTLLRKPFMWTFGIPVPECWSWWLTRLEDGGAIATISNTGMGYGMPGRYCISGGLNPWLDTEFFRQYGIEGKTILGDLHSQSIANYITHFELDSFDDMGHVKSIQQWTLLGDPSLKIGGYS
ncbi:peptidase C25 [Thermoplasmatales archaeon ex4572_165]|nr:MAG: peptidase C25 [Thermoplasmatales archaeon ex4572_165]